MTVSKFQAEALDWMHAMCSISNVKARRGFGGRSYGWMSRRRGGVVWATMVSGLAEYLAGGWVSEGFHCGSCDAKASAAPRKALARLRAGVHWDP